MPDVLAHVGFVQAAKAFEDRHYICTKVSHLLVFHIVSHKGLAKLPAPEWHGQKNVTQEYDGLDSWVMGRSDLVPEFCGLLTLASRLIIRSTNLRSKSKTSRRLTKVSW
jgi:hypothetical protein